MWKDLETKESISALLRRYGIGVTHQRIEIARVLFAKPGHLSADQVFALVNHSKPATSKATVYNTLNLFRARGLVREVIADPSKIFYDANVAPHYHFYDVDTGALTDIDADAVAITGLPSPPDGAIAEGIDLVIRVRSKPPAA